MSQKGYVVIPPKPETKVPATPRPLQVETKAQAAFSAVSTRRAKKKGRRSGGKAKGRAKQGAPSLPPELDSVIVVRKIQAYFGSGAITTAINVTANDLTGAMGGICTTANSVLACLASSIRVHKITIWPTVGTETAPECIWYGPSTSFERDYSQVRALPGGISVDRPLVSRPPRGSLAAGWFNPGVLTTAPIFGLANIPSGSIVHLDVSFTITNNIQAATLSIAAGTLAAFYTLALDGTASNKLRYLLGPSTA